MKSYRQLLWAILLLAPLLWWAWPSDRDLTPSAKSSAGEGQSRPADHGGASPKDDAGPVRTRAARQLQPSESRAAPSSPEVDLILADESITSEQAALQLHALAIDPAQITVHRLEALQHGLNLGIESFAGFAEQADLPAELASCFLDEVINYNESPVTQVRSYMALMDHPDEEVSELAIEMLRFQVGDDLDEESPARLVALALEKIEALENPVSEESPSATE